MCIGWRAQRRGTVPTYNGDLRARNSAAASKEWSRGHALSPDYRGTYGDVQLLLNDAADGAHIDALAWARPSSLVWPLLISAEANEITGDHR
jgi:hypothetical protein